MLRTNTGVSICLTLNSDWQSTNECICNTCLDEMKTDANEKYAKFEKLRLEVKELALKWHQNTGDI